LAPKLQHLLVNVLRTVLTYLVSFKYRVRKSKQFLPIAIHLYVCPSSSLVGL
jgi:hypothetical protein